MEGPACYLGGCPRGDALASEVRKHPVRHLPVTELEVHRSERDLAQQVTTSGRRDRPAPIRFRVPPLSPSRDPRAGIVHRRELTHVPILDLGVGEGGAYRGGVGQRPGTQSQLGLGMKDGLFELSHATDRHHGWNEAGHAPS